MFNLRASVPPENNGRGKEEAGILRFALNDKRRTREQNGVLAILRLVLGAGVIPAEGSVKPTAGFTFNAYSLTRRDPRV